jgi:hypothetical protein
MRISRWHNCSVARTASAWLYYWNTDFYLRHQLLHLCHTNAECSGGVTDTATARASMESYAVVVAVAAEAASAGAAAVLVAVAVAAAAVAAALPRKAEGESNTLSGSYFSFSSYKNKVQRKSRQCRHHIQSQ